MQNHNSEGGGILDALSNSEWVDVDGKETKNVNIRKTLTKSWSKVAGLIAPVQLPIITSFF